jgi:hypothetical protein
MKGSIKFYIGYVLVGLLLITSFFLIYFSELHILIRITISIILLSLICVYFLLIIKIYRYETIKIKDISECGNDYWDKNERYYWT